jgi:hypothetical protein
MREGIVGLPPPVIVMDNPLVSLPAELAALTVKEDFPAVVGVTVMVPVVSDKFKPGGNSPLSTLHVMGLFPVAASVRLYAVPTTPFGNDVVVIATAVIVMDNSLVPLPAELAAFTVKVYVFAVVGVPVIVPVAERLKPSGKVPPLIPHVMGVSPFAASVWLYGVPAVPSGNAAVVIVGATPPSGPLSQAAKENPITAIKAIISNRLIMFSIYKPNSTVYKVLKQPRKSP